MSSWISAREGAVQTSPLLKAYSTSPSIALSRNSSSWSITSAKKMFGDLPPSSVVDGIRFCAAYCMISRPVTVSPVNAIFAIRGFAASALPISAPGPVTTLITPAGTTSSMTSISFRIDHGVGDAGLSTEQFPAASAGASFHAAISNGKLNGTICPTTPSGSRKWYATRSLSISVEVPSSARAADIPLVVDHFRYFAAAARAEEGTSTEIDKDLVAYHFREPLGVVGQIVPFNFPLLMAAWKLAPALAAGNCSVLKPASPTPWSILKLMEVIEDVVPPGVIN